MDSSYEQQVRAEDVKVLSTPAVLGGSMPMPVTADVLTLGNTFLQRQLKDLLLPEAKPGMAPPHEPAAGQAVRQSSPSLLASLWPMKANCEGSTEPGSVCSPAEHCGNGTAVGLRAGKAVNDGEPVAAAAAALAETSPALTSTAVKTESPADAQQQPATKQDLPGGASAGEHEHAPAPAQPTTDASKRAPSDPISAPAQPDTEEAQFTEQELEGMAALEGILARISGLDAEGWFQAPVREIDAPNYFKIIKKPMCFQVMRLKIKGRLYVNWNEVVRDFELICSNAMKYNQRRSRIHKLALVMLRAGKKLLVEVEPEGRRAILLLQSARGAAGAVAVQHSCAVPALPAAPADPQDSQAVPSSLLRSGMATAGVSQGGALHMSRSLSTMDTATTSEILGGPSGSDPLDLASWQHPSEAGEQEGGRGYSSYSDTDMEEEEGGREGLGDGASAFSLEQQQQQQLPGDGGDVLPAMLVAQLEGRWQRRKAAVLALPLCRAAASAEAALGSGSGSGADVVEGGVGCAPDAAAEAQGGGNAGGAAVDVSLNRDAEWRQSRRSVEWRIRWLELRMRELRHQRQLHLAQQAKQQGGSSQQQQQQGEQGSVEKSAEAQAVPLPPPCATQQAAQQAGGECPPPPAPPAAAAAAAQHGQDKPSLHRPRLRRPLSDLQLPALLQHPFFGEHSTLAKRAQQGQQQAGPGSAQGGAEQAQQGLQHDDPDFPARAFVALELLERRLAGLRQELLPYQRADPAMLTAGRSGLLTPRSAGGSALARSRSRATSGSGGAATPRSRSGLAPSSKHHASFRDGELRLGKRRRAEYDLTDIITPGVMGAPKFVERAQVKTIDTPKVRLLPITEVKKREAALSTFAANLKEGVSEAKAAAALLDACSESEGSSSEEDTSDEAYLARHLPLQMEERTRYESFATGGGQAQRNKKPTKMSKDRLKLVKPSRSASIPHQTPPAPSALGLGQGQTPRSAAGSAAATPLSAPVGGMLPPSAQASGGGRLLPPSPSHLRSTSQTPGLTPSKTGGPALVSGNGVAPVASAAAPGVAHPSTSVPQLYMVPMHHAMAAAHMHAVAAAAAAASSQPQQGQLPPSEPPLPSLPTPTSGPGVGPGEGSPAAAGTAASPQEPPSHPPTAASVAGVSPLGPAVTAAAALKVGDAAAAAEGADGLQQVQANGFEGQQQQQQQQEGGGDGVAAMKEDGEDGVKPGGEGDGDTLEGKGTAVQDGTAANDHDSLPPALRAIIPTHPVDSPRVKKQQQAETAAKEGRGDQGKPKKTSRLKPRGSN